MSTIRKLIAELAAGKLPAAKEIEELAYMFHSAMLDAPEMRWLPISFEDMGDTMHKAIECAEKNESAEQAEAEFDRQLDLGQALYEDRMAA
jgi:hypothetical protein